jgi:peroxiredoxin Q/BCP
MPEIGSLMPDFALPNQEGEIIRLSDLRGKPVILFVFPKAYTSGCQIQACAFRDRLPQIHASDAVVLGMSADTVEELKRWHTDNQLNYDLLSDVEHTYLEQLDLWGPHDWGGVVIVGSLRAHYVIDEHGVLLDEQVNVDHNTSAALALETLASRS